jgi:putative pyruvate formate lyase activating enzyme
VDWGLNLRIVYNTSAYDSLEMLALLDGIVDIYMPDFKCWSPERARRYLKASDYPEAARAAIAEMHRQVGPLVISPDGLAIRGVLLRHLVMPGALDDTRAILAWVAGTLGPRTYVNLMGQYRPAGRVGGDRYPEIATPPDAREIEAAVAAARQLGLERLDGRVPRPAPFARRRASARV